MAIDPIKEQAELAKFHKNLAEIDKHTSLAGVFGSALNGAALGAVLGFTVFYKDKAHREIGKHAFYGAAIAGGASLLGYALGKSFSFAGHMVESELQKKARSQPSPVATSGYATGWYDRWGRWHHHRRPVEEVIVEPAPIVAPVIAGWEHDRWRHHHHRRPWEMAIEEPVVVVDPAFAAPVIAGWEHDRDRWERERHHHHHHHHPEWEPRAEVLAEQPFVGQASLPPPPPPPMAPAVDCPPGLAWDASRGYCLPTATQPLPPPVHHTASGYYG